MNALGTFGHCPRVLQCPCLRRSVLVPRRSLMVARQRTICCLRLGNIRFDGTSSQHNTTNNRRTTEQPQHWTEGGVEGQNMPESSNDSNDSSAEDELEANILSFVMLGVWGLVLLTSVNAVVGFISHQGLSTCPDVGLAAARSQAHQQSIYASLGAGARGASARAAVAASPGAVTPFTLMLRALAAMCGVFITAMWQATLATQAAFARVWYAIIIALVGSIMHFF